MGRREEARRCQMWDWRIGEVGVGDGLGAREAGRGKEGIAGVWGRGVLGRAVRRECRTRMGQGGLVLGRKRWVEGGDSRGLR